MKKLTLTALLALSLVALSGCASADEKVYPYSFDSAKIEYKITGDIEGSTTVMIKGDKAVHKTSAINKTGETETPIETVLLDLGDTFYQIDLSAKQGQKGPNPVYQELKRLPPEDRMGFLTKLATGQAMNGDEAPESEETKEVAGQTCSLYKIQNIGEICLWNGVPLYSSISIPEAGVTNSNTATSIQLNIEIPDSAFNVPEGVTIAEIDAG